MDAPRLTISEGMRRILDYPKFAGRTRMLVLETAYFFDRSWVRAASALGWEVATVPSVMVGGLTQEDIKNLLTTVATFKPDFILTSNYAGMDTLGLFARFFEDARIPYVSWFTDTPRMILHNRTVHAGPYNIAATWERAYMPHFKALGFEHVHFMPHATDPALFKGAPSANPARDVAFVGISMMDLADEARSKLAAWPRVLAAADAAFAEGRVTPDTFADGVECVVDSAVLDGIDASARRNLELYLVYEGTRRARRAAVDRLASLGVEVFGDARWREVTARAHGEIGYFDGLADHFRTTAVNVNITSLQMQTAVNQRVFDCPAAGGFLLTDDRADLFEFFERDREVVAWETLDELEDKARYYLRHPADRVALVERAQRRIATEHTFEHRLKALEAFVANVLKAM